MRKTVLFLGGVICGALVGASAGIFLAPQSGEETRGHLRSRLDEIRAEALEAYETRRKELLEEFEKAKKGAPKAAE
jgi:gas vesicle protein